MLLLTGRQLDISIRSNVRHICNLIRTVKLLIIDTRPAALKKPPRLSFGRHKTSFNKQIKNFHIVLKS